MSPFVLQGLVFGATLALLAFGFGLVYFTTGVFHFAHGAVYAVAAYVTWHAHTVLDQPMAVAALLGIGAAVALGWFVEVVLYQPLRERRAPVDVLFLTSLGVFMVGSNALAWAFGHDTQPLGLSNPTIVLKETGDPATSLVITRVQVATVAASAAAFGGLWLLMTQTAFGLAVRAYAANPALAAALGIDERRLLPRVAMLASALGGLAAVCVAMDVGVSPEMGLDAVVTGAVAVVIGGVGSLPGTAVGGLLVGLLRKLTGFSLGARWEEALTFALLLAILLWRPRGLLGRRDR